MLAVINATVNIKDEDGSFVLHESKIISGKVENCTITNFTRGQTLVMLRKSDLL